MGKWAQPPEDEIPQYLQALSGGSEGAEPLIEGGGVEGLVDHGRQEERTDLRQQRARAALASWLSRPRVTPTPVRRVLKERRARCE